MTNINYAFKHEDIDDIQKCTIYSYFDCFSDSTKVIATDDSFGDLKYEARHRITVDGGLVIDIISHIPKLMRPRRDDLEFTDVKVYLTMDRVVYCNIDLSTRYSTVSQIVDFVQTLITNTDGQGLNVLQLIFSRPDTDNDEFTLKKSY